MKTKIVLLTALVLLFVLTACGAAKPAENGGTVSSGETEKETTGSDSEETVAPAEEEDGFKVPKDMDEVRENVISYFKKLAKVKWVCRETMDFTKSKSYTGKLIYHAGNTYFGLPYTSTRPIKASLIEFHDSLNEKGEYTGPVTFDTLVGGDCGSMRTAWAWGGAVYDIGMNYDDYEFFENPNDTKNRVKGFIIPVGDFDFSKYDYDLPFSECVLPYNDIDVMCESYALLKACDLIGSRFYSGGRVEQHLRMIVEDATVVRDGGGKIDPDASFIRYSEQTATPAEVEGGYSTWNLKKKVKFRKLYEGNYIPVTSTCLASETVPEPVMTISGVNKAENMGTALILKGNVKCNYNIFAAELTIADENGNEVIHSKFYPYALSFNVAEIPVEKKPNELPAGKYHYTLKATIGFGTKKLIDMDFSK